MAQRPTITVEVKVTELPAFQALLEELEELQQAVEDATGLLEEGHLEEALAVLAEHSPSS